MTNELFDKLVSKLEAQARANPGGYQMKVALLALLGNAYLGLMLLLISVLLVLLVLSVTVLKALAAKLIFVVGFFLWMVLKALWVKLDPPQGTEITAAQCPELFAMIEALRQRLGSPAFHHVLVNDEFNAGVVQAPSLGIFGWPRNYLLIGLPLMKAMTMEQFKAVLAHEFGHLARGHGRMSNWIYRQRLRWSRLMAVLEHQQSGGTFIFKPFLNWYAPYFNAYSFPLARANEYEADATAARLTSPQVAAEALTSVNVVGSYLDQRYWSKVYKQADNQPQPAMAPYLDMRQDIAVGLDRNSSQRWIDEAMKQETTSSNTHPALNDRLKALGETPRLSLPQPGETADWLLGPSLQSITESFDRNWQKNILPAWQARYHEVQEHRRRYDELNARAEGGAELSAQEALERATLTESVGDNPEAALEQFHLLHARSPEDALACIALGARLLDRNDDAGMTLVEKAMQLNEEAILRGCELLRDYHWRHERKEEAKQWQQRLFERAEIVNEGNNERGTVLLSDKFEPHCLSQEAVEALVRQLRAIPGLRKVYLARKVTRYLPKRPLYVLGYCITPFYHWQNQKKTDEALKAIQAQVEMPGETIIFSIEGDNSRFKKLFTGLAQSRIV